MLALADGNYGSGAGAGRLSQEGLSRYRLQLLPQLGSEAIIAREKVIQPAVAAFVRARDWATIDR
jgi:hypothetical protein